MGQAHDDVENDPEENDHDVGREHGAHVSNLAPRTDVDRSIRRAFAVAVAVAVAVAIAVLGVGVAGCGGGALDADTLAKEVDAVASLAAEGALLADGAARARTTRAFTRVHADELVATATEEANKLKTSAVPRGLERRAAEAARLASEVATLIERLARAPGDREAARRIAVELDEAAAAAKRLGATA
jgi:hypothetical protein